MTKILSKVIAVNWKKKNFSQFFYHKWFYLVSLHHFNQYFSSLLFYSLDYSEYLKKKQS